MSERSGPGKEAGAYRTIGEVAEDLHVPQHVLRFWETRFPQIAPLKRAGGRRFYRPEDVALLRAVQTLLYADGYTIKGVQRLLDEFGARHVAESLARSTLTGPAAARDGAAREDAGEPMRAASSAADRREPSLDSVPDEASRHAAPPAIGAARPPAGDLVARLEKALADLSECHRLISSVMSIKS